MAIKIAGVDVINDDRELVLAKLTEINSSIDDAAVDVFIYDTSKDSDGGAWRHRTQHTSWYNEAASGTRGSRKEFPAVAVIVAEANKVTIYDGDDPSLPMWMVFNTGGSGSSWNFLINGNVNGCFFKNGKLCLSSSNNALIEISFIDEEVKQRYSLGMFFWLSGIVGRNSSSLRLGGADAANAIVSSNVKDVAMTVLPDAPTDPATGIAVPTIAVATDGGVSVIKDDGTVVDSLETGASGGDGFVGFDASGRLYYARDEYYGRLFFSDTYAADGFGPGANSEQVWSGIYHSNGRLLVGLNFSNQVELGNLSLVHLGGSGSLGDQGLGHILFDHDTPGKSLHAVATSDYTTGWMPGSIKLAALADTDDTDLVGLALVTNGNFGTGDLTNWVDVNSHWSVVSGAAFHASSSVFNMLMTDDVAEYAGRWATIEFDVSGYSGTSGVRCQLRNEFQSPVSLLFSDLSGSENPAITADGTYTWAGYVPADAFYLAFARDDSGGVAAEFSIDNVKIGDADPDRSVNGNGLAVHGSITKAAVATGADLVAYSGFSSSNYLEQPYNADLDFADGDFCVMGWVKTTDTSAGLLERTAIGTTTNRFAIDIATSFRFYTDTGSAAIATSGVAPSGVWQFICGVRSSAAVQIYVDGQLKATNATAAQSISNASAVVRLGEKASTTSPLNGSLALFRISATAPTADQIAKIYEDEKVLFQDSAKATLTGNSDAVTALAHDPDTDLLHVGTSGGRSVFQGLRRVEEHTGTDNQSLAAISAVDGLVVEGK